MKDFLGKLGGLFSSDDSVRVNSTEEQVQVAAAALMVHAMRIDDETRPEERDRVRLVLQERFGIDSNELDTLIEKGTAEDDEAVDLYRFTKVLTANLDQPGRQKIVRMLWEVVAADGEVHEFEANLVWRIAELLGVSRQDRIRMRQEVVAGSTG
ncbi:MAG: TerB family tellurite resistance protein [Methyloligellaceae bacterium]